MRIQTLCICRRQLVVALRKPRTFLYLEKEQLCSGMSLRKRYDKMLRNLSKFCCYRLRLQQNRLLALLKLHQDKPYRDAIVESEIEEVGYATANEWFGVLRLILFKLHSAHNCWITIQRHNKVPFSQGHNLAQKPKYSGRWQISSVGEIHDFQRHFNLR